MEHALTLNIVILGGPLYIEHMHDMRIMENMKNIQASSQDFTNSMAVPVAQAAKEV